MGQATLLLLACSRRSDSGVWREGRERGKNKEEKRALTPIPPPRCCFFVLTSLSTVPCRPPIWTPGTGNVGVHMKHELYLFEGFLIIAVNVTTIEMNVSSTLFFWHLLWLKQMTAIFHFSKYIWHNRDGIETISGICLRKMWHNIILVNCAIGQKAGQRKLKTNKIKMWFYLFAAS